MKKKKIKKLSLKKETISNLSKFEQGGIIGGYDPGSNGNWFLCAIYSFIMTDCENNFNCLNPDLLNQTNLYDGGTCDSTMNYNLTCTGHC